MKASEIKYERLASTGSYSHVKASLTLVLSEEDDPVEAFKIARRVVCANILLDGGILEERERPSPPFLSWDRELQSYMNRTRAFDASRPDESERTESDGGQ